MVFAAATLLLSLTVGGVTAHTGGARIIKSNNNGNRWNIPKLSLPLFDRFVSFTESSVEVAPAPSFQYHLIYGTQICATCSVLTIVVSEVTMWICSNLFIDKTASKREVDELPLVILGINLAIYVAWQVASLPEHRRTLMPFLNRHFVSSYKDGLTPQRLHSKLLSGYSHLDGEHLASNMLGLILFAPKLSKSFGRRRFSYFYVASIFASELFDQVIYRPRFQKPKQLRFLFWKITIPIDSLGASGAISALLMYSCLKHPFERFDVSKLAGLDEKFEVPGFVLALLSVAGDLWSGKGASSIGHGAHLGGYLFGACAYCWNAVWTKRAREKKRRARRLKEKRRQKKMLNSLQGISDRLALVCKRTSSACNTWLHGIRKEKGGASSSWNSHTKGSDKRQSSSGGNHQASSLDRNSLTATPMEGSLSGCSSNPLAGSGVKSQDDSTCYSASEVNHQESSSVMNKSRSTAGSSFTPRNGTSKGQQKG